MHGEGVFLWPDNRRYEGNYVNEKKEGFGIFYWPNGKVYKGFWKDGYHHGKGVMTETDGSKKSGIWHKGELINSQSISNLDKSNAAFYD